MLDQFRTYFPVSDDKWQAYIRCFTCINVPARTVLLHEGDISKRAYIIEKGAIRVYFNHNGDEITSQFFFENQTIASIESFKKSIPSRGSMETIEASTLWWIDKADLDWILDELLEIKTIRTQVMDAVLERTFHYMDHFISFIRDTPEQRYLQLLENAPHVIVRVPQHYIASYLGVSSVHLSRIKAKIAKRGA